LTEAVELSCINPCYMYHNVLCRENDDSKQMTIMVSKSIINRGNLMEEDAQSYSLTIQCY